MARTEMLVDTRVGRKPLFRVGEDVYTWSDVVERACETGLWAALENDVRVGLSALREAQPGGDEVEAAARAFRYARGLLAGDEIDAWLDSRGLTDAEWHDYLRRSIASERAPDADAASEDPAPHVWAEGICSGALEAAAHELASSVAVGPDAPAVTDAAVDREIESNALQWIRVRYDAVTFADEDTAGEAALCVRADGDSLAAVAERVGAELDERDDWLDEAAPELQPRFFAADGQSLIGPVPGGDGFVLAYVHAKTPPSAEDEDVRSRAAQALAERAVARAVNERVTWLEPL